MITLGIDLASQPKKTGVARLRWTKTAVEIETLRLGADDDALVALAGDAEAIGIDSPFGWPLAFEALLDDRPDDRGAAAPWTDARRDALRFRQTDRHVREVLGRWPLSVSSDLIAVPAMRCRGLLHRLEVRDRSGDGRVFEVYPALGLDRWGMRSRGYKGKDKVEERAAIWAELRERAPWLRASAEHDALVRAQDDALDAVVAAILARAAAVGAREPIPEADREAAKTEGWIVVPTPDSLAGLAAAAAGRELLDSLNPRGDCYAQMRTVTRLGELRYRPAAPKLIEVLSEWADEWVRIDAAKALGRLGDPRAVPALLSALRADFGERFAQEVLAAEVAPEQRAHAAVAAVQELRDQEDLQREAARSLAAIGGPQAEAGLAALLAELDAAEALRMTDEALRESVTRALQRLRGDV